MTGVDWRLLGCEYSDKWLRFDKPGFRVIVRTPMATAPFTGYSDMVERFAVPQVYVETEAELGYSAYYNREYVTALCRVGFHS